MSRYGRDRGESGASDCKLYVGDLGSNASKQELEESFSHYGPLRNVWVARNPPGFAFVEFEEPRDAEDAVRGLDGRTICGRRARVEMSTGMSKSNSRGGDRGPPSRRGGGGGRAFNPEDRCYGCGESGHYARDCTRSSRRGGGSGRRGGRSDSRSRSRSRDRRSRSRSASRSRSKSRSRSRSQRRSPARGSGGAGRAVSKSRSRSRSKSRSR